MTDQRIVYTNPDGGVSVVIPSGEVPLAQVLEKDVPADAPYEVLTADDIPSDRFFRGAWTLAPEGVNVDLVKAKEIGHEVRRVLRAEEFAPLDEIIANQIPGTNPQAAEAQRQAIRDKYDLMQMKIDAATTPEEIKVALGVV